MFTDKEKSSPHKLLILTQVYPPDPAAVGQYIADLAELMAKKGCKVTVLTSAEGYEDPTVKFPKKEAVGNVTVRRFSHSSFGKSSILIRTLGQLIFIFKSICFSIFVDRTTAVLVSTSPPITGLFVLARKILIPKSKIVTWLMDLNPEQSVEMGVFSELSIPVLMLSWVSTKGLKYSEKVLVLDKYMLERVAKRELPTNNFKIHSLWSSIVPLTNESEILKYRSLITKKDSRLFMYGGNITEASPVDEILRLADLLDEESNASFVFIGGGNGRMKVENAMKTGRLSNVSLLPYQSRSEVVGFLCAADVQVVLMGDKMVGIIHPSKIYNALAAGKPILYCGPEVSPIWDIIKEGQCGWRISMNSNDENFQTLKQICKQSLHELKEMGDRARKLALEKYSFDVAGESLCKELYNSLFD